MVTYIKHFLTTRMKNGACACRDSTRAKFQLVSNSFFLIVIVISISFTTENLIKNGSFENNGEFSYEFWLGGPMTGYKDAPDGGGMWSAQFFTWDISALKYQDVGIVYNGEIYKIKCYAKVDTISVIDILRSLRNVDDALDSFPHTCISFGAYGTVPKYNLWTELTYFDTIRCDSNIKVYSFYVSAYSKSDAVSGFAYLDLVSIEKVGNKESLIIRYFPDNNFAVNVFPNPFKQITNITNISHLSGNSYTARIYSEMGQLLKTINISHNSNIFWDGKNENGDLLLSGMYILKINSSFSEKIIIAR